MEKHHKPQSNNEKAMSRLHDLIEIVRDIGIAEDDERDVCRAIRLDDYEGDLGVLPVLDVGAFVPNFKLITYAALVGFPTIIERHGSRLVLVPPTRCDHPEIQHVLEFWRARAAHSTGPTWSDFELARSGQKSAATGKAEAEKRQKPTAKP